MCVENISNLNDARQLPNFIATLILYDLSIGNRTEYAKERCELIRENADFFRSFVTQEEQQWLLERTKEIFQDSNSFSNALELCTGVFDYEHILLMGWYAHNESNKPVRDAIRTLYPDFSAYLNDTKPSSFAKENQWCIDYMHEYKRAKLLDSYTNEVSSYIQEKNATSTSFYQWYYSFSESHEVLAEVSQNPVGCPDKVFWIDGLGMEYLSFVLHLIEESNTDLKVIRSQITRSRVPSSTSLNRYDGENVYKFGALDELGHDSHGYKYLYTLNEELAVVRVTIKEIIDSCHHKKCTIAIVSDHGMSCLSRKVPSRKYEGKFEHEGRYVQTTTQAETDHDYLVHKNEKDGQLYKIALTHSSLSKVPTHEVHGGCTPEEVLVPFIMLSNKNVATNILYNIKLVDSEIMLSNPTVKLSVIPEPEEVSLTCEGQVYDMKRVGTTWIAKLQDVAEGIHSLDIKPKDAPSIQVEVKVIGVGNNSDINELFKL